MAMTRSQAMSRIRSKETGPERVLREALWAAGLRGYRKNWGKPSVDVAYTRWKLAVFVDSCFWHFCPEHGRIPKTRAAWWHAKLGRNRERDAEATATWEARGWIVLRLWTHLEMDEMVQRINAALRILGGHIIDDCPLLNVPGEAK